MTNQLRGFRYIANLHRDIHDGSTIEHATALQCLQYINRIEKNSEPKNFIDAYKIRLTTLINKLTEIPI